MTLNVLMLVPANIHAIGGGIAKLMLYFSREIKAERPDIDLRFQETRLSKKAPLSHISTVFCLGSYLLRIALRRYDIVHIHVAPQGSTWRKRLFARFARLRGAKVVLHLHGSGYHEFFAGLGPKQQQKLRAFFQAADATIVLGEFWRSFMQDTVEVAADRIHVIENGAPPVEGQAALQGVPPHIVFVGAVGHRKGVDVLISALAQLSAVLPWRATICGNGEVEKYREMARAAGLAERTDFPGWQSEDQVTAHLRNADIFVLPSRAENQPVAILEAMSLAVPVVSTRVGAIPQQVVDGKTGLLVDASDVTGLTEALRCLLADKDLRRQMGLAGQEHFAANFSIRRNVQLVSGLYDDLVGK
ncbi:glycosyltransferase family 4 protein [Phaeovulum sp. W22_SRMD_FR3]|uniref:glycosyltransferase family 4 protein n=1 Tax=Phaeovulum sp. W22_SRMD_FR3 TaxID=3240274 RepID=UPI003F986446